MHYSPKGFKDIASKAKMAPAELQPPLNFAEGGMTSGYQSGGPVNWAGDSTVYNTQGQIDNIMATPGGFSGMSKQLNMAEGGMVQPQELMQEPSQGLPQYYPVSGEPQATQQQSPFATGLMPQDTPPLTPPVAPPSISTPYPARVMGSFSNAPGSNSIAPPLSSVDQTKTIADQAPAPAPTISPVAMARGGAIGGDRMASTMKAEFGKRGLDFDKYMANRLAAKGRNGDTMLAHINPQEAQMLKNAGGSGRINPDTGLMSFDNPSQGAYGDSDGGYQSQGRGSGVTSNRPDTGGGNVGGGSDKGGGRDRQDSPPARNIGDRVAYDPTSGKFYADVGKDKFVNVPIGPTPAQQQAASDAARQRVTDQLAMERAQEAQRVQQQNITDAYQQMAANRGQLPQGPLSTFGDGSDILKSGSFTGSPVAVPIDDRIRPMPKDTERTWGDTASDAWNAVKSGAGSALDTLSSTAGALDEYFRAPSTGLKPLSPETISGSAYINPNKIVERLPVDYAGFDPIRSPVATTQAPVQNVAAPLPPVRPDMSTQVANISAPTVTPTVAPKVAPTVAPSSAPPKKEESLFGNVLDNIINNPVRTGVNAVTSLIPGGALVNLGSNLTGMYPSLGQMAENVIGGQDMFSNAPQGLLGNLTGGGTATSPNQNMLTYDPVASYQNGAQFIPETTMGYGPYGNLTREQYKEQYGGRDTPVIPINTTPKKPVTPTTPDTTTPETPTNSLGLATYDPRTYLGLPNDIYNYGFGGEQTYYKATGGAVGPLSQKRK